MVTQQWASERHQHRARGREGGRARTQSDAALSSFKTMWRGRLIWSPKWLLLLCIAAPLKCIPPHTHTDTQHKHMHAKNTHWHPSAYTRRRYRCRTWVTQMCFPRISPRCKLAIAGNKEDEEARQSAPCRRERERANGKSGVFYWGRKIGREWRDTEHKQRATE